MGIASWIVIGIGFGLIARVAMPGPAAGGRPVAIVIGVLGAFAGGLLGIAFMPEMSASFNPYAVGMAVDGAIILLFLYRCIAMRSESPLINRNAGLPIVNKNAA